VTYTVVRHFGAYKPGDTFTDVAAHNVPYLIANGFLTPDTKQPAESGRTKSKKPKPKE
jgi:hypothetical protein